MYETIKPLLDKHNRIIIHRHTNPDGDAYGSQTGLKRLLEVNYPDKEIYAVGDENSFVFLGQMDDIPDSYYEGALAIIVDVCVKRLISDDRYKLADQVLVIDHHLNQPDIDCVSIIEPGHIACAELIVDMFLEQGYEIDAYAATRFLTGIVTDSGRFLYPNTADRTFEIAAQLIRLGGDINVIYNKLYNEPINIRKLRGYFINHFQLTKNKVAYMKNTTEVKEMFDVTTFIVSRAMVNQMAHMEGVSIWANFTEDEDGSILVELRSEKESIVHFAREYGGGGHALACGCTLESFAQADELLEKLDAFIERGQQHG